MEDSFLIPKIRTPSKLEACPLLYMACFTSEEELNSTKPIIQAS